MRDGWCVVLVAALVVACSGDDPAREAVATTTTTAPTTTTVPPTTTTTAVRGVGAVPATPTCPAVPAWGAPDPERPRYDLAVRVDLAAAVVEGAVAVAFTPDLPVDRLVFRLWPNGPRSAEAGARLEAGPVTHPRGGAGPSRRAGPLLGRPPR